MAVIEKKYTQDVEDLFDHLKNVIESNEIGYPVTLDNLERRFINLTDLDKKDFKFLITESLSSYQPDTEEGVTNLQTLRAFVRKNL